MVLVATDRSHRALMEKMVYTYFLASYRSCNSVTISAEIVFRSAFCNFCLYQYLFVTLVVPHPSFQGGSLALIATVPFFFLFETSTKGGCLCGICCPGSTRRLNRDIGFCSCFWRSPGSNLRPLVYKASELFTAYSYFRNIMK